MALNGNIDLARPDLIRGWAWEDEASAAPVSLLLFVNERLVARCLADLHRPDLEVLGSGAGRHAFEYRPDPPLPMLGRHVITLRREGDGAFLPGSPVIIEPPAFDAATRASIAHIITDASVTDEAALAERLAFVTGLADALRLRRAVARGPAES